MKYKIFVIFMCSLLTLNLLAHFEGGKSFQGDSSSVSQNSSSIWSSLFSRQSAPEFRPAKQYIESQAKQQQVQASKLNFQQKYTAPGPKNLGVVDVNAKAFNQQISDVLNLPADTPVENNQVGSMNGGIVSKYLAIQYQNRLPSSFSLASIKPLSSSSGSSFGSGFQSMQTIRPSIEVRPNKNMVSEMPVESSGVLGEKEITTAVMNSLPDSISVGQQSNANFGVLRDVKNNKSFAMTQAPSAESGVQYQTPEQQFENATLPISNSSGQQAMPVIYFTPKEEQKAQSQVENNQVSAAKKAAEIAAPLNMEQASQAASNVSSGGLNSQIDQNIPGLSAQDVENIVKLKYPSLEDEDQKNIVELINAIKKDNVSTSGKLLLPTTAYNRLKTTLYVGGLPHNITTKDLFALSQEGPVVAVDSSEIQKGKQLAKVENVVEEQSYTFNSVQAMMKAQSKFTSDAENLIKARIRKEVTDGFDAKAWQDAFKADPENAAEIGQKGFDTMMEQNMNKVLQSKIDQAYEEHSAEITDAGKTAVAEFKDKVDRATNAKNAALKSQLKNTRSSQSLVDNGKIVELKSTAVKEQQALINKAVEQEFVTKGFDLQVPRDNGVTEMKVLTKDAWIDVYKKWHPDASIEDITTKVNQILDQRKTEAYKTPENVAAIKAAQDSKVLSWKNKQV